MTTHVLSSPKWRVTIDTHRGMRWLSGDLLCGDRWLPVLPNSADESVDLKDCNFLLLPYSNRIRNGKFQFHGEYHQLQDESRHAIHGTLRNQSWTVVDASDTRLVAECDSTTCDQFNWPWPLLARCEITLTDSTLKCQLVVQNRSSTPMPMGGGWHPYFTRRLVAENAQLSIPVLGVYPDTEGDCLPTGPASQIPTELQFQNRTPLPTEQRIDHCFSGLQGPIEIHWPDVNATLTMTTSDNFTHAVLYNPEKPYFALEPVTHANDGVNLYNQGIDSGIETLAAGDTWSASLDIAAS